MDIGQKIREARKAKGLTLEALANQVDTDTGNLSRLERGKQGASQELLRKLMSVLGMEVVSHILPKTDHGVLGVDFDNLVFTDRKTNSLIHPPLNNNYPKRYPLVSWRDGFEWATSSEAFFPFENAKEYCSDANPAGEAFWLPVHGDAMASCGNPSFPEGSMILVDPRCVMISGKYYAYSLGRSGDFTFKQYIEDAGHKYLKPLNNNYRTVELGEEHILIGRIIDVKLTGL